MEWACTQKKDTAYLAPCLQPPTKMLIFSSLLKQILWKGTVGSCEVISEEGNKHLAGGLVTNLGDVSVGRSSYFGGDQ